MSWFEIINKQVDMGELMARIRAEQDESESNKEQERRKKLGLPEKDIEDGVKINWIGDCPKCGIKVNKSWEIIKSRFFINPRQNAERLGQAEKRKNNMRCPYFKKVGKVEGKHGGTVIGMRDTATTTKETKDISAADECPMAAPSIKNYYSKTIFVWHGAKETGEPIEMPNPDYDPTKGKFDI